MHLGTTIATLDLSRPSWPGAPAEVRAWIDRFTDVGFVRATKFARRDDDGSLHGLFARKPYPLDALAACALGSSHPAPDVRCGCGFYALEDNTRSPYHRLLELRPHRYPGAVTIEVALTGRAVFHGSSHGLLVRAERQHVLDVVPRAVPPVEERPELAAADDRDPDDGVGAFVDLRQPNPWIPRDAGAALRIPAERLPVVGTVDGVVHDVVTPGRVDGEWLRAPGLPGWAGSDSSRAIAMLHPGEEPSASTVGVD